MPLVALEEAGDFLHGLLSSNKHDAAVVKQPIVKDAKEHQQQRGSELSRMYSMSLPDLLYHDHVWRFPKQFRLMNSG